MTPRLVSAATAARWLGLHARTVRRWIADGRLAGRRIGARYYTTREACDALAPAANDDGGEPEAGPPPSQ